MADATIMGKGADADSAVLFEPLPLIASERRLHVRAYHYWRARADGRAMPTLAQCADLESADFARQMLLVDLGDGVTSARIRVLGLDMIDEIPAADRGTSGLVEQLLARLPAVALQRAPIGFEAETPDGAEGGRCFRGILLPISDDAGKIAHVLGVMSWRDVAAAAPSDDVVTAIASLGSVPDARLGISPWAIPTAKRQPRPAPSLEDRIAPARIRGAMANEDRTEPTTQLSGGSEAFVAPVALVPETNRISQVRFRLTPLGPELLAPRHLSEQDYGDLLARRLAR